jgi:flagellin
MDMDISSSGADVDNYIVQVEKMLHSVTNAAADLGSIQSRLSLQSSFTADLMDSLTLGIGTLVDADMNESSIRLKALQTQQQLGMQALSIANSTSENMLQLFR